MKKMNRRDFLRYGAGVLSSLTLPSFLHNCSDFEGIIGQYLQNVTENRATVCWIDYRGIDLEFKGDKNRTLEHHCESGEVINQVQLKNLEPGKTYEYSIDGKKRSFRTKPNIKEPFSFLVYGDSQIKTESTSKRHRKVIKQMKKYDASFVIHLGDIIHHGNNFLQWTDFLSDIEPISGKIPYYFAIGNHEYYPKSGNHKENSKNYFKLLDLPGKERYYIFEWGDCRFIFLDSTKLIKNSKLSQLNLLNKMQEDKMNIVIFHHPIYGNGKTNEEEKLKNIFEDRLDNADIVLSGHRHNYQRHLINDTNYIVSGGGGGPLGAFRDEETLNFGAKRHHFINVDVGEKLDFTVIGNRGDVIDSFSIENRFWR